MIYSCVVSTEMLPVQIIMHTLPNLFCVNLVQFNLMTNLTHNSFFLCVYFNSLHVSSIQVLNIRRFICINTMSGICHSMYLTVWYAGLDGTSKPAYTIYEIPYRIPYIVLIQLNLLIMSTSMLETCRGLK